MAKNKGPTGLGSLLAELITHKAWQARIHLHQVFTFWDEVVGVDISRHAQPDVIRGSVLWVGVSDSIWMQQLQYERQYLLEMINSRLAGNSGGQAVRSGKGRQEGGLCLTELRLTLNPSLAKRRSKDNLTMPGQQPTPTVDQAKLVEFTGLLTSIEDPDLKQAMIRVWLVMHRGDRRL